MLEQLDVLPEFVAACGFQNAKAPGFEADDFLAAAAAKEEKRGGTVFIASGDRDTFQLASDRTTILYPVRAGEMARIDPAEVRARYGVRSEWAIPRPAVIQLSSPGRIGSTVPRESR